MSAARLRRNVALLKSPTGIPGLDEICLGGIPRGRVTLVEGGAGDGKTVLALQHLVHAARDRAEPGIFVAFEESSARIIANATGFGWDLSALQRKKLFFLDAQPRFDTIQSGGFDLGGMLSALEAKIAQSRAQHIVFDAIDVILSLLDNPAAERRELYRLRDWIEDSGVTCIVTSKNGPEGARDARAEFLQFMADCAIRLDHRAVDGVSQRSLRVLKYRGSRFQENAVPYVISSAGLDVARLESTVDRHRVGTKERISSGVPRLDAMLGGGYFRNAGILATGSPGTAKTTLCGAFAAAACARGEPTLFVSFDSETGEIVRNLHSVGMRLERHMGTRSKGGLLRMCYLRALGGSAETHLLKIQELVRLHGARCLIVDPLSALVNASDLHRAQNVAKRLIDWAKTEGLSLFCTSLLDEEALEAEGSSLHISTVVDTWIHLSYLARNGERNRCLSIIKARGTAHSSQVGELLLSESGITLADAYSAGGEVLLGTLRWERERAEEAARRERGHAAKVTLLRVATEENALATSLRAMQRQLEIKQAELKSLTAIETARVAAAVGRKKGTLARRRVDAPDS